MIKVQLIICKCLDMYINVCRVYLDLYVTHCNMNKITSLYNVGLKWRCNFASAPAE